jgi:carboxyl-terminal processing protease
MQLENPLPNLRNNRIGTYIIGVLVIVGIFSLGYFSGKSQLSISEGKIEINKGDVPTTTVDYSLLWDALETLNSKYVDRPLNQQDLMYGAVAGLVEAAGDPYTNFFNPDEARKFQEQLAGSFEGIGAELGNKDDLIIVVAPLEDTPAERAGLLPGDIILEINDESTLGMTIEDAVSKIRGRAGTKVTLTILHKDQTESVEITITRAKIEIKSVKLETREVDGKKLAVLKINQFGDDTESLLNSAVDQIRIGEYLGLIVDLRNNPGGYLPTAVSTVSHWIDEGEIAVQEKGYQNQQNNFYTEGVPRLKGFRTVVLVNGGSASASEIVAGALQDYKVATLVGEKTFGKGSVQELVELVGDSELKVTIAKWFTPNGRGIDKVGLEPDIQVELTVEDAQNNRDPQMDRAIELLL